MGDGDSSETDTAERDAEEHGYPLPPIGEDPRALGPDVPADIDTTYPVEPDRVVAVLFAAVLVGVGVAELGLVPGSLAPAMDALVALAAWALAGLYLIAAAAWVWYAAKGIWHDYPSVAYGPEDVQVRILTIDAEDVVQRTVDALPDALADRHVVAESPIEVDGATVHVVPEDFECTADDKGRALEWARRHLPCEKEFVLFLDEDTLVTEFPGLPDADVVQFREWPYRPECGSWLVYWSEVLRMGYQLEQVGYATSDVPLYSWGGGLAVRASVEDRISWDVETLIEDTVFTWFAVANGASFEVVGTRFRNQAPPSLRAMFDQRRRWFVGTIRDEEYLPLGHQLLLTVRNVGWAFSPVLVVLTLLSVPFPHLAVPSLSLPVLAVTLLVLTTLWVASGIWYYGADSRTLPLVAAFPVVLAVHSFGALLGFFAPPRTFQTTRKTSLSADETARAGEREAKAGATPTRGDDGDR